MTKWIGAALLAAMMMFGVCAGVSPVKAAPAEAKTPATEFSARRHYRHYAYRPYAPYYYGRPYYYAPAPFIPIPPFFGYGWELW
jgi:hypothetical protein